MEIIFDKNAVEKPEIRSTVLTFLNKIDTLEKAKNSIIPIHQDGVKQSYYIRCCIIGDTASALLDLDARLNPESPDSFKANRELLLKHNTYVLRWTPSVGQHIDYIKRGTCCPQRYC